MKCKHFPHCTNMDDCPFVHPTEKCKYFPACSNGEKCLYLHPEIDCKFGLKCTRQNCTYTHPKGRMAGPAVKFGAQGTQNMQQMQFMSMMMGMLAQASTPHASYGIRPRPPSSFHAAKAKLHANGGHPNNKAQHLQQNQTNNNGSAQTNGSEQNPGAALPTTT